jgi:hypothetical protein
MSQSLHISEQTHLREAIISQCVWSDTYSSLKHILKRVADQLPLLVSFTGDDDHYHEQTILFFDRNVSNKILFTPLRQLEDKQDQFEVYPPNCIFATTDLFKGKFKSSYDGKKIKEVIHLGAFEFVRNGQRCSRIFTNLEELVDFATVKKSAVVFMSRDRVQGRYTDSDPSKWLSKEYPQGSIFSAQRIHRTSNNRKSSADRLECLDEDGYTIFLKMGYIGRFSLIATSVDQQKNQPEIYLHSTQTANIGQLIKSLTLYNDNNNNNNCIRLVRGGVPYNFHCQYLQLVRQHTHDVLVGLTQEGLVIEWNLESHTPCRYATNLNDILNKLSGSWEEELLETYIDGARSHYREDFQVNVQLTSTRDWAALFQYWQWTGDIYSTDQDEKNVPYQSRHRFHLVASVQVREFSGLVFPHILLAFRIFLIVRKHFPLNL